MDGDDSDTDCNGENDDETFLTPYLLLGKVQYHKLMKDDNLDNIRRELTLRGIRFAPGSLWTELIDLLKKDEKDKK